MQLSPFRLGRMGQSEIRDMTARCEAAGGINLGQGLCRVPPPAELLEQAAATIRWQSHTYSPAAGTRLFREAVANKLIRYSGIDVDPDTQVVATIGATGAFNATLMGLLAPGDGVLLLEPFYGYHHAAVRLMGLEPQVVRAAPTGRLSRHALLAAVTERTRAIVVCTPSNPTGHRLGRSELELLDALAGDLDLVVITDEIYEHIYYDGTVHRAPAVVGGLADRTITISGLSKTFSIPGWRLGYATGPPDLLERVRLAADVLSVCAPTPLQDIAAGFLSVDERFYVDLRRMYRAKLDLATEVFEAHDLPVLRPEGSYYALVDVSRHGAETGREGADLLLRCCGIGTVPLEAFMQSSAPPLVRVCFSCPDDDLHQVAERLRGLA